MRRLFILLVITAWASAVCGEQLPPLVVAVDTSRSLKPSDITAVHDALSEGLRGVEPKLPLGLVTFDDTARWLVEPTNQRIRTLHALQAVEPSGTTTVLNDALYLAAQKMENGGALLVISDGKDENSAVTVEDVESLCARHQVRILTVGVGRNIDDKALRRLALLTRGVYLGGSIESLQSGLSSAVQVALDSLQPLPEPAVVLQPEPPAAQLEDSGTEVVQVVPVTAVRSWYQFLLLALALVILLFAAGVGWWLLARRRSDRCALCGAEVPDDGGECPECQIEAIRTSVENREVADEEASLVPGPGLDAMAFETKAGGIDQTVALGEVAILTVHEEKRKAREYTLPRDRIFAVGRAPKSNTLQVKDHTVSAQHFKVVYKDSRFYVVDLWTTNGTSVNKECVRVHPLSPGDVIRAGQTEFVFSTQGRIEEKAKVNTAPPSLRKEQGR